MVEKKKVNLHSQPHLHWMQEHFYPFPRGNLKHFLLCHSHINPRWNELCLNMLNFIVIKFSVYPKILH